MDITKNRYVEYRLARRLWVSFGLNPKQISLGFSLNKYQLNIDLLFVWMSVEF